MTEDKKPSTSANELKLEIPQKETEIDDKHKDRKKLKKHRKDKIKRQSSDDDPNSIEHIKKKKKKHKCCEEHCKHRRHHKKHHRKHRKRHHSSCKEHSSSSGDDHHRHKSSSDYGDSKSNEDSGDSNDRLSTLIAVEKSPDDKMKTVIKKAVLSKKSLVKNAVLDFSNLGKIGLKKDEGQKDNLKDSGIGLEEETPSTSAAEIPKKVTIIHFPLMVIFVVKNLNNEMHVSSLAIKKVLNSSWWQIIPHTCFYINDAYYTEWMN